MTTGSEVALSNVRKSYGTARDSRVVALHSMSLRIERGEFISLLGPSGCGKSTTLGLVAGFLSPDSGVVTFDDRPMNAIPPHKRNVGMVFQNYALFPHLTVFQNIAFGLQIRKTGRTEIGDRVRTALELVQLPEQEDRYPRQLSGGQAQRVALARAIVLDPNVLLLDEPLSSLDAKLRLEMRQELISIQRRVGLTTIFVTHDQEEALSISDRVAVMNNGIVEQVGTPKEIYQAPSSLFVARFIGSANIFEGVVVGRDGELVAVRSDGYIHRIAASGAGNYQKGERATVVVRPEWLRVVARGGEEDAPALNQMAAVVRRVSFMGSTRIFYLDAGLQPVVAIALTGSDTPDFREGDEVTAVWHAENCQVLPVNGDNEPMLTDD